MNIRTPKNEGQDVPGDPFVYCQMTGWKCRFSETVVQWDGRRVLKDWADPKPVTTVRYKKYPNELKDYPQTGYTPSEVNSDEAVAASGTGYPLDVPDTVKNFT